MVMSLFEKTVAGLFDNEQALQKAVHDLQKQGFEREEHIRVIDEERLAAEKPFLKPVEDSKSPTRVVGTGTAVGPSGVTNATDADFPTVEAVAKDTLREVGIGPEEAAFFARQIGRGNSVVIVDTVEEQEAQQAFTILQKRGSTQIYQSD
jgi:hypothetical protein